MAKRPVATEDEERDSIPEDEGDESESRISNDGTDEEGAGDSDEDSEAAAGSEGQDDSADLAARTGDDGAEDEEEALPAQLGARKYVLTSFFTLGLLISYVFGRALETIWQLLVNSDAAVDAVPWLATVNDDTKLSYSMAAGGLLGLGLVFNLYRRSSVQTWADEVSQELLKVKWPSRRDVVGSTVVVLATSAIAVVYLFLLDRLWGFVTNLIYGAGT